MLEGVKRNPTFFRNILSFSATSSALVYATSCDVTVDHFAGLIELPHLTIWSGVGIIRGLDKFRGILNLDNLKR